MRNYVQSTARNINVFMADSSDHVTGKTGLTLTVATSKAGAAFVTITPTVTELTLGWYKLALTAAHVDTLGDIAFHVTATGADPSDWLDEVVAYNHADAVRLGLTALPNAAAGATGGVYVLGGTGVTISDKTGFALTSGEESAIATAVWAATTRLLTAGTNIVLAKGTGITGLNDLDAPGIRSAVGLATASLDTQFAGVGTLVWATGTRALTDKTGFALTAGERTAIANEVETQIIDDTDSEKVLTAITDKIASVNPSLGGLTTAAIASAVWAYTTRLLTAGTNIALAKGTGITGFNDLDASGVRSAVGLSSANLPDLFAGVVTDLATAHGSGPWGADLSGISFNNVQMRSDTIIGGE